MQSSSTTIQEDGSTEFEHTDHDYDWEDVPSYGTFTTIWHGNKIYGEVDPVFVYQFEKDLRSVWNIKTKHIIHQVNFNKNPVFPLIKDGWTEMKDVFGFTDLQIITLSYAGNYNGNYGGSSNFRLVESLPIETFDQVPFYHSQSFVPGSTTKFTVQLSSENINKPVLTISDEFEEYVKKLKLKFIWLCCDNGNDTYFDITYIDEPVKTTTIGNKWENFCAENDFHVGDIINFKFSIVTAFNVVHVFQN